MALKKIRLDAVPPRQSTTKIKQTPEWLEAMSVLASGLSPYEAVELTFTSEEFKRLPNKKAPYQFLEYLRKHIKRAGLEYDVYSRGFGRGGNDLNGIVYIVGR